MRGVVVREQAAASGRCVGMTSIDAFCSCSFESAFEIESEARFETKPDVDFFCVVGNLIEQIINACCVKVGAWVGFSGQGDAVSVLDVSTSEATLTCSVLKLCIFFMLCRLHTAYCCI